MKKYKINFDPIHKEWAEKIKKAGGGVIFFDDNAIAKIKGSWEEIPLSVFNQLDFIGIIRFKRNMGTDTHLWRLNRNVLMKEQKEYKMTEDLCVGDLVEYCGESLYCGEFPNRKLLLKKGEFRRLQEISEGQAVLSGNVGYINIEFLKKA